MNSEYVPLIQKEELWAQMLIQVLEDHHIPSDHLPQAQALVEELFSADSILEED